MKAQKILLSILVLFSLLPTTSFGQVKKQKFETTKLNEHAYIITRQWGVPGQKSNMGVVIGQKGVLLINPIFDSSDEKEITQFMSEIGQISDKPIKYVINSNWDNHNTEANWYFKDKDVTIISHENVVYRQNTHTQLTFKEKFSLNLGTESIIAYRSQGHSFGHINIHLVKTNATFMSDSYRSQWMTIEGPFGLDGHFKGIDMALKMGNQKTKYIPGNTTSKIITYRGDLIKEKNLRLRFSNRVLQLSKLGKSNKEILKDNQIVAIFKQYNLYEYITNEIGDWAINPLFFDKKAKTHEFSIKKLKKYVGIYHLKGRNDVEVFIKNGELFSKSIGQFYIKSVPTSDTHFWYNIQNLNIYQVFKMDDKNNVLGFTIEHFNIDHTRETLTYIKQ